jgi:hypothetical protein
MCVFNLRKNSDIFTIFNKYLVKALSIEDTATRRYDVVIRKRNRTSVLYAKSIFQRGQDSTSLLKVSKV